MDSGYVKTVPILHYDFDGRGEMVRVSVCTDGTIEKVYKDKIYVYNPKTGEETCKSIEVDNGQDSTK